MIRPGFEILAESATPIGRLCLTRGELPGGPGRAITEITIDGEVLMSTLATVSEEAAATRALAYHGGGDGLSVLVGGFGLGYTARAALQDPRVAAVRVVDRVPAIYRWLRDGLLPLSDELGGDSRLELAEGDVFAELLGPGQARWDLIVIDVDHAPTAPLDPASEPFYTWPGQRQVAAHLQPGGVLAVWSNSEDEDFLDVLAEVYPDARADLVRFADPLIENGAPVEEVVFLARNALQ